MPDMTPQELLNKAADEMARTGKFEGTYYNPFKNVAEAEVCAYGAMTRAATGNTADYSVLAWEDTDSYNLIIQAAGLLARSINPGVSSMTGDQFKTVIKYNDGSDQNAVVQKMKEAASMADIGEENPSVIEFEPLPETAPVTEPAAPAVAPAEPVPA